MAGISSINFKKKPQFADDGPPTMGENESRGSGGGDEDEGVMVGDDAGGPAGDEGAGEGGGYDDIEGSAADNLADLVGVSPDDREDFKAALQAYVASCVAKSLGGGESGSGVAEDKDEEE